MWNKNAKDIVSNPSVTSLRWISSHAHLFMAETGRYAKNEDLESK
jgi:hypothetical protein